MVRASLLRVFLRDGRPERVLSGVTGWNVDSSVIKGAPPPQRAVFRDPSEQLRIIGYHRVGDGGDSSRRRCRHKKVRKEKGISSKSRIVNHDT